MIERLDTALARFATSASEASEARRVVDFLETGSAENIDGALQDVLCEDVDERSLIHHMYAMGTMLDYQSSAIYRPQWVMQDVYLAELIKPNSASFWENFLTRNRLPETDESKQNIKRSAFHISKNNEHFYGKSLVFMGMAALYGSDFENLPQQIEQRLNRGIYSASVTAAEHFGTPAGSFTELHERLQFLFPVENLMQPGNAYKLFSADKAFTNSMNMDYVDRHCPAIKLSAGLFRGYGKAIASPEYTDYLEKRITL